VGDEKFFKGMIVRGGKRELRAMKKTWGGWGGGVWGGGGGRSWGRWGIKLF